MIVRISEKKFWRFMEVCLAVMFFAGAYSFLVGNRLGVARNEFSYRVLEISSGIGLVAFLAWGLICRIRDSKPQGLPHDLNDLYKKKRR